MLSAIQGNCSMLSYYVNTMSANGLVLNWCQIITRINADSDLQCYVSSKGHNELN